jgi:hypothetical protein
MHQAPLGPQLPPAGGRVVRNAGGQDRLPIVWAIDMLTSGRADLALIERFIFCGHRDVS